MSETRPLRALLLAATLVAAPRLLAQPFSDPGPGIGLFGTSSWWSEGSSASASLGLFGSTRVTGALGVEVAASVFRTSYEKDGAKVLGVTGVPLTVGGLLYFFPERRVQPYVVLGIGLLWVRSRGEGPFAAVSDSEFLLAVLGGAGVEVRVAKRFTAHLDARFSSADSKAVSEVTGSRAEALTARIGAAWHF